MADEADVELDTSIEPTAEVDNTTQVEDTAQAETEDVEKLREQNKKLFERAKKAEAKLKEQPKIQQSNTPSADADELRLIARGLSDEEIAQAKVLAKGSDTTLVEAIKSPLFVAFQKDLKEQARKEKAKLSASKGSSQEPLNAPKSYVGLTSQEQSQARAEHEKLAMEAAANIQ